MSLVISNVQKKYTNQSTGVVVNVLNGISVFLDEGQTLGIVGESGCGKSTLARLISGLEKTTIGEISWFGQPISDKARDHLHSRRSVVQLVFQDPFSSLNPRQKIGQAISEILELRDSFLLKTIFLVETLILLSQFAILL